MVIFTRIARFATPGIDWQKAVPLKMDKVVDIVSAADLERRYFDWERRCH
ncbi:MAG: hypothetical protein WBX25_06620 [Rhodomicrobium sp.]